MGTLTPEMTLPRLVDDGYGPADVVSADNCSVRSILPVDEAAGMLSSQGLKRKEKGRRCGGCEGKYHSDPDHVEPLWLLHGRCEGLFVGHSDGHRIGTVAIGKGVQDVHQPFHRERFVDVLVDGASVCGEGQ